MDSKSILSDIVVFNKYAKYIPVLKRRETFEEIVTRNMLIHIEKYPFLESEIREVYTNFVLTKKVLPSMRALQFSGKPIQVNPTRIYNCSYLPIDHPAAFSESMFLLLGGCGVGYSVQFHHIEKLPTIKRPGRSRRYLVGDSIEGWADAVKMLVKAFFNGKSLPSYDFSDIREKGEPLVTAGGKAPGPEPLKNCLHKIQSIFERKEEGEQLSSIEVHDIICHIADAVLAGGIRRAACIAIFSMDDEDMLSAKQGAWWELNPQRGRANNSALILRHRSTEKSFKELWDKIKHSGCGEPGFIFSNNADWGVNPCCFTGDTLIKTEHGYVKISEINGKNLKLFNVKNELVDGMVWSNGFKETNVVRFSSGEEIKCTPEHKFMLIDGTECESKDLKGKRIMPDIVLNNNNDEYVKYGFIQGDGGLTRLNSVDHKGLEIHIGEDDFDISLLFNINYSEDIKSYYTVGFNDILKELEFDASPLTIRSFPKTFDNWDESNKLSFLRGMFSANGSVTKGIRVSYKATSLDLITKLSEVLHSFGITNYITRNKAKSVQFSNGTYLCKESYDLNIGSFSSIKLFAKLIGFVHKYKTNDLFSLIKLKSPFITSVKSNGIEEVFDFSLNDDTHWGIVGSGFIAHNCEISLRPNSFCNLCEVNISDITDQEDLNSRVKAAAFIGTLQAGYTNFHYLRDVWKKTTEKEALIGVSCTGIASNSYLLCNLEEASRSVVEENKRVASLIGINPAARTTTVKPAGTTSLVLGTSSGIHAWFSKYYIRRMKIGKSESLYSYLKATIPELLEDDKFSPKKDAFVFIPIKAPNDAVVSENETAISLLERIKVFSEKWISPGHIKGDNKHNVSATVYIKEDEWDSVADWMWKNRDSYNGLSVLPFDGGTYSQTPFEAVTKEKYEELIQYCRKIDLSQVIEEDNKTDLKGEIACSGGVCELQF